MIIPPAFLRSLASAATASIFGVVLLEALVPGLVSSFWHVPALLTLLAGGLWSGIGQGTGSRLGWWVGLLVVLMGVLGGLVFLWFQLGDSRALLLAWFGACFILVPVFIPADKDGSFRKSPLTRGTEGGR